MKHTPILSCLVVLLMLCGCQYDVPLVGEATVPVDAALLGVWEPIAEEGEDADDGNMLILRFSDTEYMVVYPTGKDEMYYRAYPVTLDDTSLVQIQWLGYQGRPLGGTEKPYHVCRYQIEDDVLTIQMLNGDVVSPEAAGSQDLADALLKNTGNPELFQAPGRFRKSKS